MFSYLNYFIITYNPNGSVEYWNSTNSQVKLTALYSEYYQFICMLSKLKRIYTEKDKQRQCLKSDSAFTLEAIE